MSAASTNREHHRRECQVPVSRGTAWGRCAYGLHDDGRLGEDGNQPPGRRDREWARRLVLDHGVAQLESQFGQLALAQLDPPRVARRLASTARMRRRSSACSSVLRRITSTDQRHIDEEQQVDPVGRLIGKE